LIIFGFLQALAASRAEAQEAPARPLGFGQSQFDTFSPLDNNTFPIAPRISMGPFEVAHESIFGEASEEDWHPLTLRGFFREGWDEPFVNSPVGSRGAPKQPWLLTGTGHFVRSMTLDFFYTNGMTDNLGLLLNGTPWSPVKPKTSGNEYNADFALFLPVNRRLEFEIVAPYIAANGRGRNARGWAGNFGDLAVGSRFLLIDQRDFSMVAVLTTRTPTGDAVNGNAVTFVTPAAEFWWNFAPKWVARGLTGINILTSSRSATDVYFNKLSIGRYLTDKDARFFKQLAVFGTVVTLSDVRGSKGYISDIYLSPGIRFGLDRDQKWFVQSAIQVPVSGPHPYAYQAAFSLVKMY
jgi:hypothetical protein